MSEKPMDVRLAELLGHTVRHRSETGYTDGGKTQWFVVVPRGTPRPEGNGKFSTHFYMPVPAYSTETALALGALGAWRVMIKDSLGDFEMESTREGYEVRLWRDGLLVAESSAETHPAAIVAALLATQKEQSYAAIQDAARNILSLTAKVPTVYLDGAGNVVGAVGGNLADVDPDRRKELMDRIK